MKILRILIISMIVFNMSFLFCFAADKWTTTDTIYESVFIASLAVDWGQTRYISSHSNVFYENNWFLGKHPSDFEINRYMAISAIGHVVIAVFLPTKMDVPFIGTINPRRWWQVVWIGIEGGYIINNGSIGLKTRW